jgi:hypothetical protein
MLLLPKLYGTFKPIWTPATFEFGRGCWPNAERRAPRASNPAAGTAPRAICPIWRRV